MTSPRASSQFPPAEVNYLDIPFLDYWSPTLHADWRGAVGLSPLMSLEIRGGLFSGERETLLPTRIFEGCRNPVSGRVALFKIRELLKCGVVWVGVRVLDFAHGLTANPDDAAQRRLRHAGSAAQLFEAFGDCRFPFWGGTVGKKTAQRIFPSASRFGGKPGHISVPPVVAHFSLRQYVGSNAADSSGFLAVYSSQDPSGPHQT